MASSSIGTYTEKKLHSKIKQLKKQVDDLETFIKMDTINPDINNQMPYSVTIQFISHCVKDVVYKTLVDYITNNEYDSVTIIKDLI